VYFETKQELVEFWYNCKLIKNDMTRVAVEIPDSVFPALQLDPKEFAKEMRLSAAINWYELGRVSQGKGAEVANLSRAEFIKALSEAKLSPFDISKEDLLEELHDSD